MTTFPAQGSLTDITLQRLRSMLDDLSQEGIGKMPSERHLAEELGVSRRTVRQALSCLAAEGQIARVQGRGTIILRTHSTNRGSQANLKQYTSPAELMETRIALEPPLAALAATHASSKDLEEMRDYIRQGRNAPDDDAWERWDSAFHRAIARSSYHALLIRFFDMLNEARNQTEWGRLRQASLNPQRQDAYMCQHEAILAAITNRDPEQASKAMRQHLLTVKRTLLNQFDHLTDLDE